MDFTAHLIHTDVLILARLKSDSMNYYIIQTGYAQDTLTTRMNLDEPLQLCIQGSFYTIRQLYPFMHTHTFIRANKTYNYDIMNTVI